MNRFALLFSTSAAVLLSSGVALAQETAAGPQAAPPAGAGAAKEDVVVVTAERRASDQQSTAVAVSVLSGQDLEDRAVTSVDSLQFVTPSLTVSNQGQGNNFNIRGIGKAGGGSLIGVGVITYRDGVATYPGYFQNEPYFDIGSVEVLRGPQGTFAGQNATGGAVFINERNPELNDFNGYITGQLGSYNQRKAEGAINTPLGDTLAVRAAFSSEARDSYFDIHGPFTGHPDKFKSNSGRLSFLWEPSDNLRVLLKTDYSDVDNGGYLAEPFSFDTPFDIGTNARARARDTTVRSVLNVSYTLDNDIELRSITGYQRGTTRYSADLDGSDVAVPPTVTNPNQTFRDLATETIWSQEFNILSPGADPLTWIAGIYYQDDLTQFFPGEFVTFNGLFDTTLEGDNPKTTAAGFVQVGYAFNDALKVSAGLRYTHSTSDIDSITAIPAFGLFVPQHASASDNAVTGKVAVDYQLDANNFLFGFVATGHKAGGINGVNGALSPPRPFEGEDVTDYEVGWKSSVMDGKILTQLGIYYNEFENFQVSIGDPQVPNIGVLFNIPGKTVLKGVEATAQGNFGDLGINVGVSLGNSALGTAFAVDQRAANVGACSPTSGPASLTCIDISGNDQPYAPELTGQVGISYTFDLGDGATIVPRIDYSHIGEQWTTLFENVSRGDLLKERDILNAQISYNTGDWTATAFTTNATDEEYIVAINAGQRFMGPPRQYGVRLTKTF